MPFTTTNPGSAQRWGGQRGSDVSVLIVGAGPAGLMTAVALARHGVACRVVERRREISSLPRATAISTRSMELLRAWGLEDEIRAGGTDVEWLQWYCETLAQAPAGEGRPTGLPTRAQSALISPTGPACVPQDHLEPVLLRHLRSLAAARVDFGTEVVDVESRTDGVRAVLRDVTGGVSSVVEARYLVAADGAHSAARAALGIPMRGPDDLLEGAITALFRAPLWKLAGEHRYGLYAITHPDADGIFLPAGSGDRWLYAMMPDPQRPQDVTEETIARRIRLGCGDATLCPQIERIGSFAFAAQVAERFRSGSAFLVGDAAHRATPRGGTGMNTAIHDGYDLGWKLAWALQGWAAPQLLDSYEAERRPVAEHNVARSADPNGTARTAEQELHVDLGGRIAHAWVLSAGERVSTLDLLGPGLTLLTGPRQARWETAAARLAAAPPLAVERLDAITARAIGIRDCGALLTWPDGTPASWFAPDTDAGSALRAAVRSAIAPSLNRASSDRACASRRSSCRPSGREASWRPCGPARCARRSAS